MAATSYATVRWDDAPVAPHEPAAPGLAVATLDAPGTALPLATEVVALDPAGVAALAAHVRHLRPGRGAVLEIRYVASRAADGLVDWLAGDLAAAGVAVAPRPVRPPAPAGVDPFGLDLAYRARWLPLLRVLFERYWRVTVSGVEHVPDAGPAILAANHVGAVPIDGFVLPLAIDLRHPHPRPLRVLYDRFVDALPGVGRVYRRLGGVTASFENGLALVERGELVGLFPEGLAGAEKRWTERYLLRPFRPGAARLAVRTGAPLVPVAVVGAGGTYPLLGHLRRVGRLLGLPWLPVTPLFPHFGLAGAVPLPVAWHIHFCPPLDVPRAPDGGEDAAVRDLTRRLRDAIGGALCARVAAGGAVARLAIALTAAHPSRSLHADP
jgi:1-acyl-sn-glycerol-3-phosphate acyltransferase